MNNLKPLLSGEQKMLTAGEVMRLLGIRGASTLAKWRWKGIGPRWIKIGGKNVRYPESEVLAWLQGNLRGGETAAGVPAGTTAGR
jgi:predicted DNA-binding transcriptional regulator AlpA